VGSLVRQDVSELDRQHRKHYLLELHSLAGYPAAAAAAAAAAAVVVVVAGLHSNRAGRLAAVADIVRAEGSAGHRDRAVLLAGSRSLHMRAAVHRLDLGRLDLDRCHIDSGVGSHAWRVSDHEQILCLICEAHLLRRRISLLTTTTVSSLLLVLVVAALETGLGRVASRVALIWVV